MSENEFLTVQEVAQLFRTTEQHIYAMARENLIPSVRLGRRIRFSKEELEEWTKSGGKAHDGGWRRSTREEV